MRRRERNITFMKRLMIPICGEKNSDDVRGGRKKSPVLATEAMVAATAVVTAGNCYQVK